MSAYEILHSSFRLSYSLHSYSLHLQIKDQVLTCSCTKIFSVIKVAEGQYRVSIYINTHY